MKFTEAQTEAYQAMNENVLVSAGAGSGKTQVLSERVRYLVQEKGYHINEFLILTFTNLAAGEMKNRIRKKLNAICSPEANLIDNAAICTFDSYALSLVKKYHYLLNLNRDITIIDENVITIFIKDKIDQIFEQLYQEGNPNFISLIKRFCFKDDDPLKSIIYKIYKLANESISEEEFLDDVLKRNDKRILNDVLMRYEKRIDEIENQLEELYQGIDNEKKLAEINKQFEGYHDLYNLDDKANFLKKLKIPSGIKYNDDDLKEAIKNCKAKLSSALANFTSCTTMFNELEENKTYLQFIVDTVRILLQEDNKYKYDHQAFCFNDIAKMALRILQEHPDIKEEIKSSLKTIMIDEYQDTSKIQEAFITLISNNNVYQVGDVKQSIYRFRKATPEIFIQKFADYQVHNGGRLISLSDNFRSRPEVLDDINKIFSEIMTLNLGGADYQKYHIIGKGNKDYQTLGKCNQDHHLTFYRYENNGDSIETEARIIAQDIIKKMNDGYQIYDNGVLRKAKLSDFCILMDRGTSFETYQKVFSEYKIPLFLENNVDISNNQLLLALTNLLRLVNYIENEDYQSGKFKHAFLSLGRSFIYNYDDDKLYSIIKNNDFDCEIINDIKTLISNNKHKNTYSLILDFISYKDVYHELVKLGNVQIYEKYLDDFITTLDSLNHLGFGLMDYINYFDKVRDLKLSVDIPSLSSDLDAVKLMNIFKSKGLEFPVIYCSGLEKRFNNQEYKDNLFLFSTKYGVIFPDYRLKKTIISEAYKREEDLENISEKIRLLYVALTRAKEKIICLLGTDSKAKELENTVSLSNLLIPATSYFENVFVEVEEDLFLNIENNTNDYVNLNFCEVKVDDSLIGDHVRASKDLSLDADREMLLLGEKLHFDLELIDFINPDFSFIKDPYELKLIQRFLSLPLIKTLIKPLIYKEYRFDDDINNKNGIIDCLIIDNNQAFIIDYKLKNIDDDSYIKQLKTYYDYVKCYFNIEPECYLYSIINGIYKKICF